MIIIVNFFVNFLALVIFNVLCCDCFSGDLSPREPLLPIMIIILKNLLNLSANLTALNQSEAIGLGCLSPREVV
jgi:hypothetical protein